LAKSHMDVDYCGVFEGGIQSHRLGPNRERGKAKDFFEAQKQGFAGVADQANHNFSSTASGLTTAIDGLKSLLRTTQKVVENVTGANRLDT
jgi:hypothetical protein